MERCAWAGTDPDNVRYHDEEWGRPVTDDNRLFEKLCLEGFQSGLSWLTILKKRPQFRKQFKNFDPVKGVEDDARPISSGCCRTPASSAIAARSPRRSTTPSARSRSRRSSAASPPTSGGSSRRPRRRRPSAAITAGANRGLARAEQGSAQARLQLRRSDDVLRLHAGDGAGERPLRPLRLPQAVRGGAEEA